MDDCSSFLQLGNSIRKIHYRCGGRGTLINKTEDEAYNLIEKMALNNFQWFTKRVRLKQVGGKLQVDALTLLSAKIDAMSQRLDRINVNAVKSSVSPPCEIWGSIEHVTLNCQVRSSFS